jgi:hypothetical protein
MAKYLKELAPRRRSNSANSSVGYGSSAVDARFNRSVNIELQASVTQMSIDSLEPSLKRLRAALDLLEAAIERRARQDSARGDAQEELALMQDDRARLAVELDGALDRNRGLLAANIEAARRVERASAAIKTILDRREEAGAD